MTVHVIVQLKMTDRAAYDRYQARFAEVFKKFSGRLLRADENPTILEGAWDRDKLVLMSFPDEAAFHAWADSPEYLEISKDRKAGAQAIVLLARGFAPECGMTFLRIVIPLYHFCLSMISGQTLRVCPEGKPVPTHRVVARGHAFPDHALAEAILRRAEHDATACFILSGALSAGAAAGARR